jgi:hypothetical protein
MPAQPDSPQLQCPCPLTRAVTPDYSAMFTVDLPGTLAMTTPRPLYTSLQLPRISSISPGPFRFCPKVLGHFPVHFKSHPLIYPPTSVGLENRVQWNLVDFVFSDKSFPRGGGLLSEATRGLYIFCGRSRCVCFPGPSAQWVSTACSALKWQPDAGFENFTRRLRPL